MRLRSDGDHPIVWAAEALGSLALPSGRVHTSTHWEESAALLLAISCQRHKTDGGSRLRARKTKKRGFPLFYHVADRNLVVRYILTFFLFARAA
jgi:hypothetical protein